MRPISVCVTLSTPAPTKGEEGSMPARGCALERLGHAVDAASGLRYFAHVHLRDLEAVGTEVLTANGWMLGTMARSRPRDMKLQPEFEVSSNGTSMISWPFDLSHATMPGSVHARHTAVSFGATGTTIRSMCT